MIRSTLVVSTGTDGKSPKSVSLLGFLTRLIRLCLLPLLLPAVFLAGTRVLTLQAERKQAAEDRVRNIATAIDYQISSQIAALQLPAASPLLDDPQRLKEFYKAARAFHDTFGGYVILADLSTQMLLHTREPFGADLPKLPRPEGHAAAPAVLETGKPAVGDMFWGPLAKEPLVAVVVPVIRDGQTRSLLLSIIETRRFQRRLDKVSLPQGWSLSVLDGKGAVMAGRAPPEKKGYRGYGEHSGSFVAKSALSHWSVVLEVPRYVFLSPIVTSAAALAAAILVATFVSLLGGRPAGRRLAASVAGIVHTASPDPQRLVIAEIEAARQELVDAAAARETAESTRLESERRYRDLYENAPDMYASVDAKSGRIVECNQTMVRSIGYSKEEIIGRPFLEMYHSDSLHDAQETFQAFRTTGRIHNLELRLRCRDGGKVDVILNASAVYDESGQIAYIRTILRDITERKKAEQALRESEESYRMLFREMLNGFAGNEIICDSEGRPINSRYLAVNPAFERITGLKTEAVVWGWTKRRWNMSLSPSTPPKA